MSCCRGRVGRNHPQPATAFKSPHSVAGGWVDPIILLVTVSDGALISSAAESRLGSRGVIILHPFAEVEHALESFGVAAPGHPILDHCAPFGVSGRLAIRAASLLQGFLKPFMWNS